MALAVSYLLLGASCVLAILVAVLCIEIAAALLLNRAVTLCLPMNGSRPPVAILVPAHNESAGVLPTVEDLKAQLHPGDRLIVIADNCTDDTAATAEAAGAEIFVRNEPDKRGKGFALAFALQALREAPPEIVIIIDADCRVKDGSIDRLAAVCAASQRPIQAADIMTSTHAEKHNIRIAEFAWRVKNIIRPTGLAHLNLPCQLMGTGMAFPWHVISSINLATGSLAEDLGLGLNLARTRKSAMFYPFAEVTSYFPQSTIGTKVQRDRWETGHVRTIVAMAPRLLAEAIRHRNFDLFALTLDSMVPPLSLLVLLLICISAISGIAVFFGVPAAPFAVAMASVAILTTSIVFAWSREGRHLLPLRAAVSIPLYAFAKLPMYCRILTGHAPRDWIRTDRKGK
jgi:cellulose synthase/poly-beta-1,6-N-acetylglucosamine synthase-like glycosyltransferase